MHAGIPCAATNLYTLSLGAKNIDEIFLSFDHYNSYGTGFTGYTVVMLSFILIFVHHYI